MRGLAAFFEPFGECDILGEILEIHPRQGFPVFAVPAGQLFGLRLAQQVAEAGRAGAVLAGRHHPRLAAIGEGFAAGAAAFLVAHLPIIIDRSGCPIIS